MKLNGSQEFIQKAKEAVYMMVIGGLDPTDNVEFSIDNVYVVNSQYVLGNQKAQLSTTLPDGKYYEVTYNATKEEMYIDGYVKFNNHVIK